MIKIIKEANSIDFDRRGLIIADAVDCIMDRESGKTTGEVKDYVERIVRRCIQRCHNDMRYRANYLRKVLDIPLDLARQLATHAETGKVISDYWVIQNLNNGLYIADNWGPPTKELLDARFFKTEEEAREFQRRQHMWDPWEVIPIEDPGNKAERELAMAEMGDELEVDDADEVGVRESGYEPPSIDKYRRRFEDLFNHPNFEHLTEEEKEFCKAYRTFSSLVDLGGLRPVRNLDGALCGTGENRKTAFLDHYEAAEVSIDEVMQAAEDMRDAFYKLKHAQRPVSEEWEQFHRIKRSYDPNKREFLISYNNTKLDPMDSLYHMDMRVFAKNEREALAQVKDQHPEFKVTKITLV